MLTDVLKEKKCLKLVCGAGNLDAAEAEKLVALYSLAGFNFFDLSADLKVIDGAKRGLQYSGKSAYLCVSVGVKGDLHVSKAVINSGICTNCGKCYEICPQNAVIKNGNSFKISKIRCIGCGKCVSECPAKSVSMYSEEKNFDGFLPEIIKQNIDCIEFHISSENTEEIFSKWSYLNENFGGILSICADREKFGNEKLIKILRKMIRNRKPDTTIIQADGSPMSGGNNDFNTTLQTVATADLIIKNNIKSFILLSGGTNSKSAELAKLCSVPVNGISIGTYARKIVSEYIRRKDFLQNRKIFDEALEIAKNLVADILRYMQD